MDLQQENLDSVDIIPNQTQSERGSHDGPSIAEPSLPGAGGAPILDQNEIVTSKRPLAPSNARLYAMNGVKRGKVLIFNHIFKNVKTPERKGTEKDVARLRLTLPKLGFQPEDTMVYNDLTSSEINDKAIELQNDKDLENSDCLLVVIMTHGEKGDLLRAKDDPYHLYRFLEYFSPSLLRSMVGKPKIFIIQACRGDKKDKGAKLRYEAVKTKDQADSHAGNKNCPDFADLLIVMSSHYEHVSIRNENNGSWLIQELCNVIERCDLNASSIFDILTKTNNAVSKLRSSKEMMKQIPSFHSTLTRKLYFSPIPNQEQRIILTQPPESTVQSTGDNDIEKNREPESKEERQRKREREWMEDKERDRERVRKQQNDWMKERELDRERQRQLQRNWEQKTEEDRNRERKQEREWEEEKKLDRKMQREWEEQWAREKEKEREKEREREREWKREQQGRQD